MLRNKSKIKDTIAPQLRFLYFYLTSYCNLNCLHCWIAPGYLNKKEAPAEASLDLLKDIIDQAIPLGLKNIKITGGEPLLNKDIFKLIEYAKANNLGVNIETNGTLIDDSTARFFSQKKVGNLAVSLDGPCAAIHERLRGEKGCFKKTIEGLKLLKKYSINTQVIMSLYKDNIDYLEETINIAEKYGAKSFKINVISCVSRGGALKKKDMTLSALDYIKLGKVISEEIQPSHKIKIILDIPLVFRKLADVKNNGVCSIKNILGILPDARISICGIGEVLDSLVLGDLRKDSLESIWKNNSILRVIREDLPKKLEGICASCVFKGVCLGKCRAEAYYRTGSMFGACLFCEEAFKAGVFPSNRIFKIKEEVL